VRLVGGSLGLGTCRQGNKQPCQDEQQPCSNGTPPKAMRKAALHKWGPIIKRKETIRQHTVQDQDIDVVGLDVCAE
jgi:hypothetical protein